MGFFFSSLSPHLEYFDLTGGRVEVFCVLFTLVLFKRVDLDPKRHPLFSSMLAHCEFRADAVYLKRKKEYKMLICAGMMT